MREKASGKFVLRIPPDQHATLQRLAAERAVSLNVLCRLALGEFLGKASAAHAQKALDTPLLESLKQMLGPSLAAVIMFGSAARGTQHDGSDIDLLIVVAADLPVTRALYRRWDERRFTGPHSLHFVHLPDSIEKAGSIWLEAAVDGDILFEADGGVRRFLRELRRAMANGRFCRRTAHGHPYWVRGGEGGLDV